MRWKIVEINFCSNFVVVTSLCFVVELWDTFIHILHYDHHCYYHYHQRHYHYYNHHNQQQRHYIAQYMSNGRHGVSNHRQLHCFLNSLFKRITNLANVLVLLFGLWGMQWQYQISYFQTRQGSIHCAFPVNVPSGKWHKTSLMNSQHWLRWRLGADRQQAITWGNGDPDLWRHQATMC